MIDETTAKGKIIAAALRLAAAKPWREIALIDIAEAADVRLSDLREHFTTRADILRAFSAAIDDAVLKKASKRPVDQAPRDAIFEVVMSRFDALEPYKAALRSIVGAAEPDPALIKSMLLTQHWMLEAAGVGTSGPRGAVRTLGLASVYASVFRTWLDDDDPGLARTMAALDRRLRRGEQNMRMLDDACGLAQRIGSMFSPGRTRRSAGSSPAERSPTVSPGPSDQPQPL